MTDSENEEALEPGEFTDPSPNPENDADLSVLCDALQEHGITRLVVQYQGSGDSGGVEEFETTPQDVPLPAWVEDKIQEVAEGYCPDGYENNEGGYGTLTVLPFAGLAQLEHCDRFEDSEAIPTEPVVLPQRLRSRLVQLGITTVTARFDGYSDSGQIDEMTAEPPTAVLGELEGELEEVLLEMLPDGWEINEGSYGEFHVDVRAGQIELEGWSRIEQDSEVELTRWQWRK
jgi:hypothetical protein